MFPLQFIIQMSFCHANVPFSPSSQIRLNSLWYCKPERVLAGEKVTFGERVQVEFVLWTLELSRKWIRSCITLFLIARWRLGSCREKCITAPIRYECGFSNARI
jgi:hypothetical protein